ncbi:MAG: NAD(P)-dependent oxidoreductase [bacterium]
MIKPIVILDGYPINPGDLSWEPMEAIGSLTIYDRTPAQDVVNRARGFELVLTNKTILSAEVLKQLHDLKYIGVLATGYNIVDVDAARERGIVVSNVPDYSRDSVAQLVFAFLLELTVHTARHDLAVKEGDWVRCADFSFTFAPVRELAGKVLGIVGLGSIGKRVAQIGHAFGMLILASGRSALGIEQLDGFTVQRVPLDELLHNADVVTLHCPLTQQTKGLINASRLSLMKKSALVIK